MKKLTLILFVLAGLLVFNSCDTTKKAGAAMSETAKDKADKAEMPKKADVVELAEGVAALLGDWAYTVKDTPEGDMTGILSLKQSDKGVVGVLTTDDGSLDLKNFSVDAKNLKGSFSMPEGYTISMKGAFEGENLKGTMQVLEAPDYVFDFIAKKK